MRSVMKGLLAAAVVLAATAAVATPVNYKDVVADVFRPGSASDTGALRTAQKTVELYELTAIGPTTGIDSGVLDVRGCGVVTVVIFNGNTTSTRTPTLTWIAANGASTRYSVSPTAIAANGSVIYVVGPGLTTAANTTGTYGIGAPYFKVTTSAPASGAGNSTISVWCR